MALIRPSPTVNPARDAVVLDLGDLARQADLLRAGARAQAETIVRAAHEERARILAGAADEGRAQGRREGVEQGTLEGLDAGRRQALDEFRARLDTLEQSWTAALTAFSTQRERLLEGARADVLDVALLAAEKVIKRALEQRPDLVVDQVGAVLAAVARPTESRVAVHPDDEPLVREALPALAQRLEAARHARLETDASLDRGSCVLRTPGAGEIDASVRTQLDRIVETLLPDRATRTPRPAQDPGDHGASGAPRDPRPGGEGA